MDVPAPFGVVVKDILFMLGDKVSEGSVIMVVTTGAASAAPAASHTRVPARGPIIRFGAARARHCSAWPRRPCREGAVGRRRSRAR